MKLPKHINSIVISFLRELRALRGYHILYSICIKYFFVNFFVQDNVTLIYTIPPKVIDVENKEFLVVFYTEIRQYSPIKRKFSIKKEKNPCKSVLFFSSIFMSNFHQFEKLVL